MYVLPYIKIFGQKCNAPQATLMSENQKQIIKQKSLLTSQA